ncbi:lipase 1 [Rhipicephalus sanguineus]|uniref:lipase 1 n=1 Tax=Rhipicephalus sanguineus TaxID=34632 RepID=UPI0020C29436|nr:lipase 1 [Rhipicephalus sanguineus]
MFNYGSSQNKELYGQEEPPEYPVERIKVAMALFSSEGDTLANPEDLSAFIDSLSSPPLFNHVVPQQDFRHIDFLFGLNTYGYLHKSMIETLEKYTGTTV